MFSVSPEIYHVLSIASRWLFAFFALMLLLFAFAWHHADRRERRDRFRNLPGAGTVGELVVLSGSSELPPDTWFPVPREGVLGSLRSCDLVIPCPGVRSQHLDFSWQDGTGLLIRPRIGCDVLVDGVPVLRRGAFADVPLLHGSVLQVGTAVLRLQLFAALSHTSRPFVPQQAVPEAQPGAFAPPAQDPYAASQSWQAPPDQVPVFFQPVPPPESAGQFPPVQAVQEPPLSNQPFSDKPLPDQSLPDRPVSPPPAQRRKRVDRWKEDWSE